MRIMVVDDEKSLCDAVSMMLSDAGYEVVCASCGPEALHLYERHEIDLAVLDVMLPGMDGFELCDALRSRDETLPILMLSAKSDIVDKRSGFRAGADDYLGKPFDEEELLLRVEALLRRRHRKAGRWNGDAAGADAGAGSGRLPQVGAGGDEGSGAGSGIGTDAGALPQVGAGSVLACGELVVDVGRAEVVVRGEKVALTRKEFEIVRLLASRPGRVFTREDIIDEIWGEAYREGAVSIPTYVRRIRMKIEKDPAKPQILQTVFGFGYRIGN